MTKNSGRRIPPVALLGIACGMVIALALFFAQVRIPWLSAILGGVGAAVFTLWVLDVVFGGKVHWLVEKLTLVRAGNAEPSSPMAMVACVVTIIGLFLWTFDYVISKNLAGIESSLCAVSTGINEKLVPVATKTEGLCGYIMSGPATDYPGGLWSVIERLETKLNEAGTQLQSIEATGTHLYQLAESEEALAKLLFRFVDQPLGISDQEIMERQDEYFGKRPTGIE